MQIYRVGGAVRDKLLNYPCHENDWVVVGSSPEEMVALGYRPVGQDFPVLILAAVKNMPWHEPKGNQALAMVASPFTHHPT